MRTQRAFSSLINPPWAKQTSQSSYGCGASLYVCCSGHSSCRSVPYPSYCRLRMVRARVRWAEAGARIHLTSWTSTQAENWSGSSN